MTRVGFVFLFFVAVGGTSASAQAIEETEWPFVQTGGVDTCDAMAGVALARYQFLSQKPRHSRYILADICADIDAGWLVGPEVFEGLTLVQSYGPSAGQFEVIEDAPESLNRRSLTQSNVFTGLEEESTGVPMETLAEITARMPGQRAALMPGTDQWSMTGYLYGPAYTDVLPEGIWFGTIGAAYWSRLQGNEVVDGDVSAFNTTFHLFERTETGFTLFQSMMGAEPVALGLEIDAAGEVSGSIVVEAKNGRLAAARDSREYDNATLEIGWLKGRVVDTGADPVIAAVGIGRTLFRDIPGNVNIEDGWIKLTLTPMPDGMTPEDVSSFFGDAQ